MRNLNRLTTPFLVIILLVLIAFGGCVGSVKKYDPLRLPPSNEEIARTIAECYTASLPGCTPAPPCPCPPRHLRLFGINPTPKEVNQTYYYECVSDYKIDSKDQSVYLELTFHFHVPQFEALLDQPKESFFDQQASRELVKFYGHFFNQASPSFLSQELKVSHNVSYKNHGNFRVDTHIIVDPGKNSLFYSLGLVPLPK